MAYCLLILLLLLYFTHVIYLEFGTRTSEIVGQRFSASAVSNGSDAYTVLIYCIRVDVFGRAKSIWRYHIILCYRQTLAIIIIYYSILDLLFISQKYDINWTMFILYLYLLIYRYQ